MPFDDDYRVAKVLYNYKFSSYVSLLDIFREKRDFRGPYFRLKSDHFRAFLIMDVFILVYLSSS